jgi:hypothetical protein
VACSTPKVCPTYKTTTKSCIKVKVIEDIFYLSLVTIAAVIAASIALKI